MAGNAMQKVIVQTLSKGRDGATWYSGAPDRIPYCKAGDFCFDAATFDIYKCIKGGIGADAIWENVCNLDAGGDIRKIYEELQALPLYKAWFGTRAEYNALTAAEKYGCVLHFIEEGS